MIPSPNVTNDQQYKNAKVLADKNAAVLIREKDLTPERLADEIAKLSNDPSLRAEIQKNVRDFAVVDSNKKIYQEMLRLIKEKKN